jgi:hypothetical protein
MLSTLHSFSAVYHWWLLLSQLPVTVALSTPQHFAVVLFGVPVCTSPLLFYQSTAGDWLEGYMHGYGTYHFGNGDRYSGDWREGSRHGKGDYTFRNGCRYSGELFGVQLSISCVYIRPGVVWWVLSRLLR